jgi:two-component system, NarL family, nitrate/nitrite response regulator NarL
MPKDSLAQGRSRHLLMNEHKTVHRPIRVQLIAEPLVAWGLERLVQSAHPRLEVVGRCERVADCAHLLQRAPADLALLDLDVEDGSDGVSTLYAQTHIRILAISGSRDLALHDNAVLSGARGVVEKRSAPALLLKAIEKVHEGELWVDRAATSRIFMELARQKAARSSNPEHQKIASLTKRERHSIAAVASDANASGKVIAARLNISEHTLRNHLTSIYSKLGVANRLALYAYARQHGLHEIS